MKITPLEIRQKTFEQKFRGYDKEEVDAFLQALGYEWERMYSEFRETKSKLEVAEKDVRKLREVESSLYKALKTAEDTSATMVDQANKTATLHLKEAQMDAEMLVNEAKKQSRNLLEETEEAVKLAVDNAKYEIQKLEQEYKVIQNQRENLLHELKNLATDSLERANRYLEKSTNVKFKNPDLGEKSNSDFKFSLREKPRQAPVLEEEPEEQPVVNSTQAEEVQEFEFTVNTSFPQDDESDESDESVEETEEVEEEKKEKPKSEDDDQSSFFDQI